MEWFKRLFGKRTKQESQVTSPAKEPAAKPATETAPDKAAEPAESTTATSEKASAEASETTPAKVEEKLDEPVEVEPAVTEVAEAVEVVEVVETKEPESSDPALSQLDTERTAAELPVTEVEPTADNAAAADVSTAETPAAAPVAEKAAPAKKPAKKKAPAAAETVVPTDIPAQVPPVASEDGPFGPGSAKPLEDGAAPSDEYTVKGKRSSKLFHTAESPYFSRTKADVWFKTPADAESAGFAAWNHKKKAAAK
ncbi:sunset domain-containing protein [Actinophytocola sediminis]